MANQLFSSVSLSGQSKYPVRRESDPNHSYSARVHLDALVVFSLILISLFLRFYKLGEWSLWTDEAFTILGWSDGLSDSVLRRSFSHQLIQWVVGLLGDSEWAGRLVPALLGALTIPLFYLAAQRLVKDRTIAALAALLLAMSPWHIYWSQNVRYPVALLLFFLAALYFFYVGMEEDRPSYFVISFLFLALVVKERLYGLFFLPVIVTYILGILLLGYERPAGLHWKNLLIFTLPTLALGIPLLLPYAQSLDTFGEISVRYVNSNPYQILGGVLWRLGFPVIGLGLAAAMLLTMRKERFGLLLILNALVPLVALLLISLVAKAANHYIFVILPAWLLLASYGLINLVRLIREHQPLFLFALVMILVAEYSFNDYLYYEYYNGYRQDFRSAYDYLRENMGEDDQLIASDAISVYYGFQDVIDIKSINSMDKLSPKVTYWILVHFENAREHNIPDAMREILSDSVTEVAHMDMIRPVRALPLRILLYPAMALSEDRNLGLAPSDTKLDLVGN